ncbi:unnamed protein product [Effrenium voratum]|uniref:Pseudouridine synthase RsuA/RluA-like domain-containing protein n=1 Tax=Effrenium voratum TaxID=2562239 RepID=A0AA36IYA2_9DINO|nr:unnamed protein product [Effrenium voratum]
MCLRIGEAFAVLQDKHMAVLSKSAGWIVAISRHKEQNKYFDKLLQESAVREAKELVDSGRCEHLCHFIALKFKEDSSFQLSNNLSCEWGIAHRLDVDTSGAIMIGKTAEGFRHLREAFSSHVVFKEYLCLVHGAVKESSGEVNQPILWDCGTNTSCISSSGDWAQTFFTRVGHYRLKGGNQVFSLCRIVIVTGRTHQIRVHMASIGHPLVSDGKYNSKNKTDLMWCPRMFLHAWRLGFYDLFYAWQEVRTSLPSDLRKALRMLSEIKIDVMRPDDPSCRVIHASRPQDVGTKRKAEASPPEALGITGILVNPQVLMTPISPLGKAEEVQNSEQRLDGAMAWLRLAWAQAWLLPCAAETCQTGSRPSPASLVPHAAPNEGGSVLLHYEVWNASSVSVEKEERARYLCASPGMARACCRWAAAFRIWTSTCCAGCV